MIRPHMTVTGGDLLALGLEPGPALGAALRAMPEAAAAGGEGAALDRLRRVLADPGSDLVETIATFHPRIVRMADAGEKPED